MASKSKLNEESEINKLEKSYGKRFFSTLNEMRKSGINTDVVVVCGAKKFPAHRLVLSAGSPYFKSLLESKLTLDILLAPVDENTFSFILEFLYSSMKNEILFDNVDFLLDVFQTSLLLEMTELSNYCWNLIQHEITVDDYFNILNMKTLYIKKSKYTEEVLQFVLVNFKAIVRHEKFLSLNETWMKFLLKKFREKRIPIEDFMIEGILRWIKEDENNRKCLQNYFFYFNYELTSKEYIKQLLRYKADWLTNNLKTYMKIMVEPKLNKRTKIAEILENMSLVLKPNEENTPLSFIYFGYSFVKDVKLGIIKRAALKIKDSNSVYRTVTLPLYFDKLIATFQHESLFYFVAQNATKSWVQYLLCCDLQSEEFVLNVQFTDKLTVIDGCKIDDVVYMITRVEMQHEITYYSEQEKTWGSISVEHAHLLACVDVGNLLYVVVCKNSKQTSYSEYYFIVIKDKMVMNFETKRIAMNFQVVLNKKLITVYQGMIFIFFHNTSYPLVDFHQSVIYDPTTNEWKRKGIKYKGDQKNPMLIKCCSTKNRGIIFYTRHGSILLYDVQQNELTDFYF